MLPNLGCHLGAPGKREPQLRGCLHQIGTWACLSGIFLMAGLYRKAQPIGSGAILRQVGSDHRKVAKQTSKLSSSMVSIVPALSSLCYGL